MAFSDMQWERKTIPIKFIELDPENPRLGLDNRRSDLAALTYLVEHENVLGLAQNIADYKNLYPHESIICIPIENEKYIVVEGNRRVAACKILLKPHIIGDAGDPSEVPEIDNETRHSLTEIEACVADSRQTADEIIAKLHIDEFGKLSWNTRKKIRYVESRLRFGNDVEALAANLGISTNNLYKLKSYGRVFTYVSSMLKWTTKEKGVIWDDKVDLDIMFYVLTNKVISSHFGHVLFSDAGEINYDFPDRDEICKKIAQHTLISQRLHIDYKFTRNTAVRDYLNERFPRKHSQSPSSMTLDLQTPTGAVHVISTGGTNITPPMPPISDAKLIDDNPTNGSSTDTIPTGPRFDRPRYLNSLDYSKTSDRRLKQLASEARQISQIKPAQVICLSFLIRAIFEQGLITEINRSGLQEQLYARHTSKVALDDLIKFCIQNKKSLSTPLQLIKSIEKLKDDRIIFEINQNIHGGFGNLSPERMQQICGFFLPIFDHFMEKN
ncbi:hypothetical protein [Thalassospira alkalitolerans]|uniref:hypothetical protein n=1 Tax=Thalassospira alkalitolerans TaxID=1293890 RepID=UPI003AA986A5